jgi:hypothetical protein
MADGGRPVLDKMANPEIHSSIKDSCGPLQRGTWSHVPPLLYTLSYTLILNIDPWFDAACSSSHANVMLVIVLRLKH